MLPHTVPARLSRAVLLLGCAAAVASAAPTGTPGRCNAETFRAYDRVRAQPGTNPDAPDVTLSEPLARPLHARRELLTACHAILGRTGPRSTVINLQARLNTHGVVEDLCVLEDSAMDAPTLDCVANMLRTTVFPPGLLPWMFRWRVRLVVE